MDELEHAKKKSCENVKLLGWPPPSCENSQLFFSNDNLSNSFQFIFASLSSLVFRQSKCTAQAVPDKIRQSSSSRIGANVRSSRRDIVLSSDNCDQPDGQDGVKKKKKKKKKDEEEEEEEESHIDPIPIVCAVFIASVFGGPVCLIANLKLGMFAAIGGGIMGYTTGKMFSDHG